MKTCLARIDVHAFHLLQPENETRQSWRKMKESINDTDISKMPKKKEWLIAFCLLFFDDPSGVP